MRSPSSTRLRANGLEHHVLEWSSERTGSSSPTATVFLIHGFMDAAGTWDLVAPALVDRGHRVFAPDMRGFGVGARAPEGSYYHFSDYVADLAALLDIVSPSDSVMLVGHSMGGVISTLFAGAFPERVRRLANLEGLGPPDNPFEIGPIRVRTWINDLRRTWGKPRTDRPMPKKEAHRRLQLNHPGVPHDVLAHRLPHLVRDVDDDNIVWLADRLHRTTAPVPFFTNLFVEFIKQITCPVLFVSGGERGFHPPDEELRLAAFQNLERVELEGAGHMMHWTKPKQLCEHLVRFLT